MKWDVIAIDIKSIVEAIVSGDEKNSSYKQW